MIWRLIHLLFSLLDRRLANDHLSFFDSAKYVPVVSLSQEKLLKNSQNASINFIKVHRDFE